MPVRLIVVLLLLPACTGGAADADGLPWSTGDELGGWRVHAYRAHQEFVRIELDREGARTTLEIAPSDGTPGPFASRFYRVQPAPGESPPEDLVAAVTEHLRAFEARPEHVPFIGGRAITLAAGTEARVVAALLLALNVLVLLLFAAVVGARARHDRVERRGLAVEVSVALVVTAVAFGVFGVDDVPVRWATPLHEGGARITLDHVFGVYANSGPNFSTIKGIFAPPGPQGLRALLRMDLWLAALNALLVVALLRRRVGLPLALAFTAAFAATSVACHAAVAENPAMLGMTYVLLGVVAAGALVRGPGDPRWRPGAALALLAAATAALAATRVELAGPGFVALPVAGLRVGLGPERVAAWSAALRRLARRRWYVFAGGALALLAALQLGMEAAVGDGPGWFLLALRPINPQAASIVPFLLGLLPPALVALALVGFVRTLVAPLRSLLLPFSVLVLLTIYRIANIGMFVPFRHLLLQLPFLVTLAMVGLATVVTGARRLPGGRVVRWGLAAVLVPLLAVPPWRGMLERIDWNQRPPIPPLGQLLDRDNQRDARFLLDGLARFPTCTFVSVASHDYSGPDRARRCDWIVFGGGMPRPFAEPRRGRRPEELVARYTPDAPCAVLHRGLDANLDPPLDCAVEPEGRPVLAEWEFESWPSTGAFQYGYLAPRVRLGLYALPRGSLGAR